MSRLEFFLKHRVLSTEAYAVDYTCTLYPVSIIEAKSFTTFALAFDICSLALETRNTKR